MWLQRLRLELGVELAAEEVRMIRELNDLDVGAVRRAAGDPHAAADQHRFVLAVELVAMAMALADLERAVGLRGLAVGLELAGPRAQAHGAAQLVNAAQLAQLVNDAVRRRGVELAGVGVGQTADVASKLDARRLHAQADPEVG